MLAMVFFKFHKCLSLFPLFSTSLFIHFWPLCHLSLQTVCLSFHLSRSEFSLLLLFFLNSALSLVSVSSDGVSLNLEVHLNINDRWPTWLSLFLCFMFALNSVRKQLFSFLFLIKAVHYCIRSILIVCFSLSVLCDILFNYCRKLGQSMTIYNLVVLLIQLGETKRRERENERAKVSRWLE